MEDYNIHAINQRLKDTRARKLKNLYKHLSKDKRDKKIERFQRLADKVYSEKKML